MNFSVSGLALSVTFGDTSPKGRGFDKGKAPMQNKSAPQQSCAAQKTMLHALQKGTKGYTSSRKSLGVSFFEENAAVPTHCRCTLLSVKRYA